MPTLDPTQYSWTNPLHVYDPLDSPAPDRAASDHATLEPSEFLCAGDHPAREVEWLWPDRIPLGKVSLLIGNPGLGKSLLTIDMAARVTRALSFPAHQPPALPGVEQPTTAASVNGTHSNSVPPPSTFPPPPSPGSVIILSASDDLTDTIRPRLDAAGADAKRVFVLPKIRDLRTDFDKLRAAVEAAPNCRLVIVDPVNAYVGPSDSHFHTVVRRVLEPLAELAAEKNLAILAVTHLRKNDGAAIQRAAGSMGFVSMARTIWTVAEDPQDPARRLFLPLKNNLGPDIPGLAFHIESHPTKRSPLITWDPTPLTVSNRAALATPKPPGRPTERDAAREFLRHTLADGPRPARDLFREAKEQGFTPRTLQRAFHELDGHTTKEGFLEGWWWSIGEHPVEFIANPNDVIPDFGGPANYAADVGFCDALRRSIDMERFQAVTGRKHLSPSLNVSPSQNPRRSTTAPPPDHLSPSEDPSPSEKLSPSNPEPAIHNPKSSPPPAKVEDRGAVRNLFQEMIRQLKQTRPATPPNQSELAPNARPAACGLAKSTGPNPPQPPATRPLTPPPPPENDIINKPPTSLAPSDTTDFPSPAQTDFPLPTGAHP